MKKLNNLYNRKPKKLNNLYNRKMKKSKDNKKLTNVN